MKLLPATSFFFFLACLILISSCDSANKKKNSIPPIIEFNEKKAKQFRKEKNYDSAIYYRKIALKEARKLKDTPSIKESYYKLYLNYKDSKMHNPAIFYLRKLYNLSEQLNDTIWMAKTCHKKGSLYKAIDSFKLALENFTNSKNLYLKKGDTIAAGKELLDITNVFKSSGNFGASELSASEGLVYLKGTDELKTIVGLYLALTTSSRELNNTKTANDYINKALALVNNDSIAIKKIGISNLGKLKNAKGNVLKDLKRYDEAIEYYKSASKYYDKDTLEIKRTQFNLAHTLFLKNGYSKVLDSLLLDSYTYYVSKKEDSEIFSTLLKLAELYKDTNQNKFLKYIDEALQSAEERKKKKSVHEALELKLEAFPNKKDYKQFVALGDELERDKEDLNYFYINYRFNYEDAERKKNEAERKQLILDEKLARGRLQSLILLLILISLLVITFFIYQRIKRKHKIEKVKTVHVTEARISTKVHDELANDLYELMTQLETANPEKEVVLDKLDTIYNQARDISKQIQSIDTDQGFSDELSNLFRTYQSNLVNVLLKRYDTDIWKGISEHIKITLYRVLQEFLTNMKKHSNASLVVVSIEKQNKQLFIQYIDNGKGFTSEISKNGLRNAENRIRAIKGKLTFETELPKGCKFSINVPV